jgi:DNA-binding transcriptional LysR family regulator
LPDDLHAVRLFRDDHHVVDRKGHPLLRRGPLQLHDLVGAEWMLPASTPARRAIEERFAQAGLPAPRVAIEYAGVYPQLCQLVVHSDLLAIAGERILDTPAAAEVRHLPLAEGLLIRHVGMVVRSHQALSPLAARFSEMIQEVCVAPAWPGRAAA